MKPHWASVQGGRRPWQGLLLTACLLALWTPSAMSQLRIESVPPNAAEGQDVLLRVHNQPANTQIYRWFRGATTEEAYRLAAYSLSSNESKPGPANSGRETILPHGSLAVRNVTVNDSGVYTLDIFDEDFTSIKASGQLRVFELVTQPSIHASNTTVMEQESVVLTCHSRDPEITIRWIFNDQSLRLSSRTKLSEDNSTLSIDPVRREDSGEYRCEVSNPVSVKKSEALLLSVSYDPAQSSSDLSPGAIAGIVVGVVAGVALIAALAYFLYSRKTGGTSDQRDLTEHKPSASSHSRDTSRDNSPNEMDEVSYTSLKFNAAQPKEPTFVPPASTATEIVYSEVKKK
ncbi:carcinoembryonic antigen-related cell adhesion molecule 1 isoform X3 [Perognathus longimembris pacificus]|uniref:carcinoembryonic antigen-related cell adhesion molecule 1 isoform X3 n=1 Tax=Perognathus longimembris pacificus TaxID=214514 RepID=UPI0020185FAE|nr:carcinoembryonic antigen-related cell adhesion molecule 1 isoform X3 [Perognathus longimembris pacificus]